MRMQLEHVLLQRRCNHPSAMHTTSRLLPTARRQSAVPLRQAAHAYLPCNTAFVSTLRQHYCKAPVHLRAMTQMAGQQHDTTPKEQRPKPLNDTFDELPTTIFELMTRASMQHNSINLGQGFPDDEGPDSMKRKAGNALLEFPNQYAPLLGVLELRQAVAAYAEATHPGLAVNPATETLITLGATEGLACAMLALLNPGDEVVLLDPMYDAYGPMCRRAGGVPKLVPLDPETWDIRRDALAAAFSSKTKMLLLNSPHNPTGKVFSRSDLEFIAQLCVQHNVYVVSDEVYEHLVFTGHKHVSIRSLPGMADRVVRLGSAGKTFSLTAWKVGWVTGPARLVAAIAKAHQFVTFCIPSNLQRAVAFGLQHEQPFYKGLGGSLQGHREFLQRRLEAIGFRVLPGQGTYFLVADIRPLAGRGSRKQQSAAGQSSDTSSSANGSAAPNGSHADSAGVAAAGRGGTETDVDFCQRLTAEAGVTLIPVSAFYSSPDPPSHLVRFCFCKSMDKLRRACDQLEDYFRS